MLETQENGWRVFTYDTWGEMVEAADKRVSYGRNNASRREGNADWSGTQNWGECLRLAIDGWEEGVKKTKDIREKLFDRVSTLVEKTIIEYDCSGTEYDMGAYLSGIPECWSNTRDTLQEGSGYKHIRIVYNCIASGGVGADVLMAKGAAVCALIDLLEHAGHRVEVWLVQANAGAYLWRCSVKPAGQPLDLARLIFCIAHPSTLRRVQFALCESVEEFITKYDYGYGRVCEAPKEYQGDVYIGSSGLGAPQWVDCDSATAWVIKQLIAQGIHVEGLQEVPAQKSSRKMVRV